MATREAMTLQSPDEADSGVRRRVAVMGDAVSTAAGTAATAAGDVAARMPAMAATARTALVETNRQIRTGSDEVLIVGGALAFGFALGLLFGGANRLAVAAAMLPAASMGFTILERANQGWLDGAPHPKLDRDGRAKP